MGWEERNGQLYYYRKRRQGKRVISEYVGAGYIAELTANVDQLAQAERRERRQAAADRESETRALGEQIDELGALVLAMVRAELLTAGYHPHKRQWRKRHNE